MVTPNGTNGINGFGGFDDERETLLHTALFKQVSSEEARELLPYLLHAEYDKGDFIFREGDTDHRMYLLEEGRVKLNQTILRQACAAAEHPRVRRSVG